VAVPLQTEPTGVILVRNKSWDTTYDGVSCAAPLAGNFSFVYEVCIGIIGESQIAPAIRATEMPKVRRVHVDRSYRACSGVPVLPGDPVPVA
jgi:hypothetical protein